MCCLKSVNLLGAYVMFINFVKLLVMYWVGQKKNFTVSQQNVLKYVPIKLVFDGFQCDTQHHTRIWYFKYCRLLSNFLYVTLYLTPSWDCIKLSWAGGNPLPLIASLPTSTLSFSIFYFFPFLLASSVLLLWHPFHSTRTVPLHFQAGCRRRQLNLALVFLCWFYVICIFTALCYRGICCRRVSVRLSVRDTPVLYRNG